jgi:NADPH:quinone reductase-like Zn-dependent oxidoreductase
MEDPAAWAISPIQFAKARGARVLTTVSTKNVGFARDLGADVVIDYKTQRFEDHAADSTWCLT